MFVFVVIHSEGTGRKIAISSLPLGGAPASSQLYDFGFIDVYPLTFVDIIDYVRNRPSSNGIIADYEFFMYNMQLMRRKVPQCGQLLWPDLLYANYLMWALSVSADFGINISYTCNNCRHNNKLRVGLEDIAFKPYGGPGFIIETPNGQLKGWFRRGAEMEKKISDYVNRARGFILPFDVAVLMMSLELYDQNPMSAEQFIKEATHDTAYQLLDYYYYITHPIMPVVHTCENPQCGSTREIPIQYILERDFFLVFLDNREFDAVSRELGGNNTEYRPDAAHATRDDTTVQSQI
jgi:hypothetical protein